MIAVRLTPRFRDWRDGLRDSRGKAAIARRIDRLASGNPGDAKFVGNGVSELRIDHGPGYRVYYMWRDACLIVLLCGGDKSTQSRDISEAIKMATNWTDDEDKS
jgi:putative addiction module killer protein